MTLKKLLTFTTIVVLLLFTLTGCFNSNDSNPFEDPNSKQINALIDLIKQQDEANKVDFALRPENLEIITSINDLYAVLEGFENLNPLYSKAKLQKELYCIEASKKLPNLKNVTTPKEFNATIIKILKEFISVDKKSIFAQINYDHVSSVDEVYEILKELEVKSYLIISIKDQLKLDYLNKALVLNVLKKDKSEYTYYLLKMIDEISAIANKAKIAMINPTNVNSIEDVYKISKKLSAEYRFNYLKEAMKNTTFSTNIDTFIDVLELLNTDNEKSDIAILHLRVLKDQNDINKISNLIENSISKSNFLEAANNAL